MSLFKQFRSRNVPMLLTLLAALVLCSPAQTESTSKPAPAPSPSTPASPETAQSPPRPLSAKELREAQIAADTEKLYQLAQQLKIELDKSNKDTLSLSVIKKAAEIEKLAHSISERMKSN